MVVVDAAAVSRLLLESVESQGIRLGKEAGDLAEVIGSCLGSEITEGISRRDGETRTREHRP